MMSLLMLFASLQSAPVHAGGDDLAYFKQFLFQQENTSSDPDFPNYIYHYLQTDSFKFMTPDHKEVTAFASIEMYPDGHTVVVYRESIAMVFPGAPAGSPPLDFPNGCKTYQGTWSVPDTSLVLSGTGNGVRDYVGTLTPPQAVKVTFDHNLISAGLAGVSATFTLGFSNIPSPSVTCF